ncbi:hypothetical protein QH494_11305 [Sphingomonas sp. AR_OL41]|uniref:hypothetical protein n=1 Tax=Sphingomonas sp. AR_OL41 TaxID=3042729 RepID=UPI002480B166|nr:hypothetical protein [Sphingomonas sp. AR_OL41]MDH7972767.1 hypothetical protein [Sphingomonas sp. AR_OL41]MDH7972773.1 hypothetical protein [Sphingomonas sp. AR_OL41]
MALDNFAEGDSGVPTPHIAAWNAIQAKASGNLVHPVFNNFGDIQLYIVTRTLGIATDDASSTGDKIASFDVARRTLADYLLHSNRD